VVCNEAEERNSVMQWAWLFSQQEVRMLTIESFLGWVEGIRFARAAVSSNLHKITLVVLDYDDHVEG
jgi:hypothetical protein